MCYYSASEIDWLCYVFVLLELLFHFSNNVRKSLKFYDSFSKRICFLLIRFRNDE